MSLGDSVAGLQQYSDWSSPSQSQGQALAIKYYVVCCSVIKTHVCTNKQNNKIQSFLSSYLNIVVDGSVYACLVILLYTGMLTSKSLLYDLSENPPPANIALPYAMSIVVLKSGDEPGIMLTIK